MDGTLGGQGHTNAGSRDHSLQCVLVSRYTVPGTVNRAVYVVSMWHAMHTLLMLCNATQCALERGQGHTNAGPGDQAPAVYRKIPVYRDWTQIPIPGFLKIKYRYFSGFWYSTQDNVFKDVYWFLANFRVFGDSQNL